LVFYNSLLTLSNQPIENYSLFEQKLNSLLEDAEGQLRGLDLEFMKITISVAKKSAKLWLSTDKGGSGLYDEIKPKLFPPNQVQLRDDCSDSIIAGDIGGAAGVFMGWGSTLLAIPGTNAAVGAAIAWGAAWGSGMAALNGCPIP